MMRKNYTKPGIEFIKLSSENIAADPTSIVTVATQDSYKTLDITYKLTSY